MPEYSPVIKEGAIKNKQFQIVAKFTLSPQKRTITVRELLAMCVGKLKFSEVNNVRQMSIIDGQGRRCAIGKFVNNVFIPGAGFTIRRPAQTTGSGSGGGSGEGSDADYASFEPSLLYPTDFSFGAEPPTDKCTLANKKCCPTSSGPIRYFDGKVVHTVTEIDGNGELPWGHTRSYDNTAPFPVDQRNGYRWKLDKVPYLNVFNEFNSISDLDSLDREITQVVISGGRGASFLTQGGGYVALGNGSETMRHRQEIHAYEIRWADGAVALFNDFDDEFVAQGCLRSMTLADGHTVTYFYNADKSLACMERVFHEGGVEVREEIGYEYAVYSDGVSRIGTVTYRRSEDGGLIWMNLKRIEYTYYRGNEFHGSLGDLKLATTMTRAGNDWIDDGTYYYRYYKEGEQKGFIHALKYILEPAEYVQFRKFMPLDSIDSQLAPYATNYFEYDGQKRVVLENVDGGRPASRFAYSEGASGSNKNHWAMKTTETLPDGSVKIYYTNRDANVLLTAERPSASAEGQQIVNYYTFDDEGNQVQHATPESIASYKDYNTYSYNSELVVNLHSGQGLIRKNVYYSGVTGQPNGKLFRETIQRGNYGTPITVAEYEYAEKKLTDTAGNVLQQESFLSKTTRFAGEQNDKPVVVAVALCTG